MALLQYLKSERAQQKRKHPLTRSLFARISGLVKEYGLGESFLHRLDTIPDSWPRPVLESYQGRAKALIDSPLFPLVTAAEYRITMAIIEKVHNPYLYYAQSPDEILLCGALFRCNPELDPERLAGEHFAALLLQEAPQGR